MYTLSNPNCQNTQHFLIYLTRYNHIRLKINKCGNLRIQSECGKIRTRKNSDFGHFSRSGNYDAS